MRAKQTQGRICSAATVRLRSARWLAARIFALAAIAIVFAHPPAAHGLDYTWTGSSSTSWATSGNWLPHSVPGPVDEADFTSGFGFVNSPSVSDSRSLSQFHATGKLAQSFTATLNSGSTLSLMGTAIGLLVDLNSNPNIAVTLSGLGTVRAPTNQSWVNNNTNGNGFGTPGSGQYSLTVSSNVGLGGGITLTLGGSGNTLIGGSVFGSTSQLAKTGTGSLVLTGSNTYTGTTTISAGTLQIGDGGGTGSLYPGGQVNVGSAGTLLYSQSGAHTVANYVYGGGVWTFSGAPSTVFTFTGTASAFTGKLNVNSGVLSVSGSASTLLVPSTSATINVASGAELALSGTCSSRLFLNGTGAAPGAGALVLVGLARQPVYEGNITLAGNAQITGSGAALIGSNISGPYQLTLYAPSRADSLYLVGGGSYGSTMIAGSNTLATFGGPSTLSSGALAMSGGTLQTYGNSYSVADLSGSAGQIQNANGFTPSTLTLGSDNSSTTFAGTLVDGGSAPLRLTKTGIGALLLTGNNTYSGSTAVNQGELLVNGSLLSAVTVNSGGTLAGLGSLANVTVGPGGQLAPGDAPGQMTLSGSLALQLGASLSYGLDTPLDSDMVFMPSGSLSLSGQQFTDFNFTPLANFAPGAYTLIDAGWTSGSLGSDTSGTINGFQASLAVQGDNLVLTVVPEPSTTLLGGASTIVLAGCILRRRKQTA